MKSMWFIGLFGLILLSSVLGLIAYDSQKGSTVQIVEKPDAESIGNNIWVTDDPVRGVSCYRSAGYGGPLSCVKVK